LVGGGAMDTAAIYIRVSTEDQAEYSPDAQKRLLLEYANRNHYDVPSEYIYIDEGISGRLATKRPAFMRMIGTAKRKPSPFQVILVHKFDRFSRSREDSILYKSLLKRECGVKVISITEHIEDDKFSVILEAMLEAMAEYYSLNLSDEVLKGMTEKALRGGYQAAPPLGYVIEHKGDPPIINEEEASLVHDIFDSFLNQSLSPYEIARSLNSKGYHTKRGNPFEKRTVEYILRNPFYAGYVKWCCKGLNGKPIISKGVHKALITDVDYERIVKHFSKRVTNVYEHSVGSKHWLSGIVKCSNCGRSLIVSQRRLANSTKGYYNLQCCGYQKGLCNISHQISERKLLSTIYDSLKEIYPQNNNIYQQIVHKIISNPQALLNERKKQLEKRLLRIQNAYLNGVDTIDEYKISKISIMSELNDVNQEIQSISSLNDSDIVHHFTCIVDILRDDSISNSIKSSILHGLIDYIIFDKPNEVLKIFYKIDDGILD
ncbi:MAG TPA: recombinase family protein, partial [Lachnospiraceae bacterium]|nr:recombinase family protein [Lachnospiraceae bacterium]